MKVLFFNMKINILLYVYISYEITKIVLALYPKKQLVVTEYGPVMGLVQNSRKGRQYMSFRGIPYAKPPIGQLRFKAPQKPDPWIHPVNATQNAPFCIQKNTLFADPKVEGEEDCLYLNIYLPLKLQRNQLLPVMVFIHWGGFIAGRGSSDYIGPEYLMDKDVILVSFNYRLGVMGFFTTLDDHAPGNFGMKDQVLALKFVQENIGYFGGDKNRVTIFGQSAGSGSVGLHMVSPSSRGLFQQAISESGSVLDFWARTKNYMEPSVLTRLASYTGCDENLGNNAQLVECLRNVDAESLVETVDKFLIFSTEPATPYSIVAEEVTEANPDPFLTKDPLEYLQNGEFQKVPWIVGTVQNEGNIKAEPFIRQTETYEALNANFSNLIPQILLFQYSTKNFIKLFENISDFYLGGNAFVDRTKPESVQGFINLYGDRLFYYGIYQALVLQSLKGHTPIWVYNFNYKGQFNFGDLFAATNETINFDWGVSHCDELIYLFRSPALFPDLQKPTDLAMIEIMTSLWTNFAIYGDPDPKRELQWTSLNFENKNAIRNENINYINITGRVDRDLIEMKIQRGFFTDRMKFWASQDIKENFPRLRSTIM